MIVENLPLTLLKVVKKEGTAKASGKPYSFLVANIVDDDANVFAFNLTDDLAASAEVQEILTDETKNLRITATVKFLPKGFDVAGTLVEFVEEE